VASPARKTHRGGLELGGSVHEEAHPRFPCFIQPSFKSSSSSDAASGYTSVYHSNLFAVRAILQLVVYLCVCERSRSGESVLWYGCGGRLVHTSTDTAPVRQTTSLRSRRRRRRLPPRRHEDALARIIGMAVKTTAN